MFRHLSRRRTAAVLVALSSLVVGLSAVPRASAGTGIFETVVNTPGGVAWRSAPDWNTPINTPGTGIRNGARIELTCWQLGTATADTANDPLWYYASYVDGGGGGQGGEGYLNDHFIWTNVQQVGGTVPGVPQCPTRSPDPTPTTPSSSTTTSSTTSTTSPQTPSNFVFTVVNAGFGIYWRSAADWNTAVANPGHGVYNGDQVRLSCWLRGGTDRFLEGNTVWYQAAVVAGRGVGAGFLSDHFIWTGLNLVNGTVPGVPSCSGGETPVVVINTPKVAETVLNGVAIGFPDKLGRHLWGSCQVQDFYGGSHGHVIVSYTNGTHIVRDGMLWGWYDNNGPTGLGCPTSEEGAYLDGVKQAFTRGSLVWRGGMDHATRVDQVIEAAIDWTLREQAPNLNQYAGDCLKFVADAYAIGTGRWLKGRYSLDPVPTAFEWWGTGSPGPQHPATEQGGMSPPRGALVYWGPKASRSGEGHVALSLGGGSVISSSFGGNNAIHVFSLNDFKAEYVGWKNPVW